MTSGESRDDFLAGLGELALVSRLRRLSDALWEDTAALYAELGFEFQPRWFVVFLALGRCHRPSVSDLAAMLGLTTQRVGKIADELVDEGLVHEGADPGDSRVRRFRLSQKGRTLFARLEPVWRGVRTVAESLMAEAGVDLVADLDRIEAVLKQRSLVSRFREHFGLPEQPEIEIVDYRPAYKKHFRALNEQWLQAGPGIEEHDARLLADPNGRVLKRGGQILFALFRGTPVGTCALIRHRTGEMELAKLAVAPEYRSRGIGFRLGTAAVQRALASGVGTVYLRTHPGFPAARRLFRKLGFRSVRNSPLPPPEVTREAVTMRLNIDAYRRGCACEGAKEEQ